MGQSASLTADFDIPSPKSICVAHDWLPGQEFVFLPKSYRTARTDIESTRHLRRRPLAVKDIQPTGNNNPGPNKRRHRRPLAKHHQSETRRPYQ